MTDFGKYTHTNSDVVIFGHSVWKVKVAAKTHNVSTIFLLSVIAGDERVYKQNDEQDEEEKNRRNE